MTPAVIKRFCTSDMGLSFSWMQDLRRALKKSVLIIPSLADLGYMPWFHHLVTNNLMALGRKFDVKTALLMHYMDVHSRHFGAVKHVLVITYKVQWQVLCLETSSQ